MTTPSTAPKESRTQARIGRVWRVGLLATTLVMGLALVGSGLERYRATIDASWALTEAEVGFLIQGARREMVRHRDDHDEILQSVFEELEPQGVRYVALFDASGQELISFGEPTEAVELPDLSHRDRGRQPFHVRRVGSEGLVHAFAGAGRFWHQRDRSANGGRRILAVELQPKVAARLIDSARHALMLELVAAVVLFLAAIVFWRMSRRAESFAGELERDRQLKMLGQMSAVLGHELKNPLAALKGHAQLLDERLEGHEAKLRVDTMIREVLQLEDLVGQVLDFARSGELNRQLVYVDDLVNSVVTFAGVDPVEVDIPSEELRWSLDRSWMERVLVNILRNARQASGPGEPVELRASAPGGLVLEIRDRGEGIPSEMREKIFEPFYTSKATGTGLGLALARQIVEAHGGAIIAGENPGGGAVFTIEIPPGEEQEVRG